MTFTRSLTFRILLSAFGTLFLSLIASVAVFLAVSRPMSERMARRLQALDADAAATIYEREGTAALVAHLRDLDRRFGGRHHLTDRAGRDVVDGTDRANLLGSDGRGRRRVGGYIVWADRTDEGRYRLLFVGVLPAGLPDFLRYYIVFTLVIAGLLYLWLSFTIASPLRALSQAVERFGRGELDVRAPAQRRGDEIGELGRAFNAMAQRLKALLTAERRLLQDISHELRSPLARLTVAIEVYRTDADRDAAAAHLQREVARLTALVDSLVEATREEGGPGVAVAEPVDVWGVLVAVADSCSIEATVRGVRFVLHAPAGRGVVRGNPELLRRAFENVVRNAIRYAPEGSAIELEMRADVATSIVSVRDYGPGVPEEDLSRLGTPFFRSDVARDAKTGGVGLGLAIARRGIVAHRGTMTAENATPGLRLTMQLPNMLESGDG